MSEDNNTTNISNEIDDESQSTIINGNNKAPSVEDLLSLIQTTPENISLLDKIIILHTTQQQLDSYIKTQIATCLMPALEIITTTLMTKNERVMWYEFLPCKDPDSTDPENTILSFIKLTGMVIVGDDESHETCSITLYIPIELMTTNVSNLFHYLMNEVDIAEAINTINSLSDPTTHTPEKTKVLH